MIDNEGVWLFKIQSSFRAVIFMVNWKCLGILFQNKQFSWIWGCISNTESWIFINGKPRGTRKWEGNERINCIEQISLPFYLFWLGDFRKKLDWSLKLLRSTSKLLHSYGSSFIFYISVHLCSITNPSSLNYSAESVIDYPFS